MSKKSSRVSHRSSLSPSTVRPVGLPSLSSDWKGQETRAAKSAGGSITPGSGCGGKKGDVQSLLHMVECKTTGSSSLRVQREWLEKLRRESSSAGLQPVLFFGFDGESREDWAAIPDEDFQVIVRVLQAVSDGDLESAQCLIEVLL